jgi:hypothetical protein
VPDTCVQIEATARSCSSLVLPCLRASPRRAGKPVNYSIRRGGPLNSPAKHKAKISSLSHSFPRPPQAPAAPFKRAYRKCRLRHSLSPAHSAQAALPISPNVLPTSAVSPLWMEHLDTIASNRVNGFAEPAKKAIGAEHERQNDLAEFQRRC